ncbi:MAG TPA: glycosyltransferase [Thermoanaerobaculia bacterium]|nr:glycosyltransferase [Thermoanaerobaculia bacterium]
MRLLVVATKAPWPPIDGGRLLLAHTLAGLAAAGLRPTLVAPVDAARFDLAAVAAALDRWCEPRLVAARLPGRLGTLLRALPRRRGLPLTVARHSSPAVRAEVERLLATRPFDLVHAEQLQALPQAEPARARRLPVVLRAQNVESDLWAGAARGRLAAREARLLAAWEGEAVASAAATLALTRQDAERLGALAEAFLQRAAGALPPWRAGSALPPFQPGRVRVVSAPFPEQLDPGEPVLSGSPPVVVLASLGWPPNQDAAAWFTGEVWPVVRAALPGAELHLFGIQPRTQAGIRAGEGRRVAGGAGITRHELAEDSAPAFARGSIHAVPLRLGSGLRMKILEAWARGVPVLATPQAAAGLEAADGQEVLLARDAAGFAAALARLHHEPALAATLIAGGRAALRRDHDPSCIARQLVAIYDEISNRRTA